MESQTVQPRPRSLTTPDVVPGDQDPVSLKGKWWRKLETFSCRFLKMEKKEWLEDMRGNLGLVATLIAAITFQAGVNPPGGIVQTSTEYEKTIYGCNTAYLVDYNTTKYNICTGQAVLAILRKGDFLRFLWFNAISFVLSLSAALLLVSGIPLRHRFLMWFLSIAMTVSLTFLALTYMSGALLVTPAIIWREEARKIFKYLMIIWIGLLGLIILFIVVRFLVWFLNRQKNTRNTSANI